MKLHRKTIELIDGHAPFALASLIKTSGSTPQKPGAQAIFEPTGAIWGTLGGGCLEAESRARALQALDTGRDLVFDLSLDEDYGWDDGLICGGRARILVQTSAVRYRAAYAAAADAADRRARGALLTEIEDGRVASVAWLDESDAREWEGGLYRESFLKAFESERCVHAYRSESAPARELFLEPVLPAPRLIIAGGGHIGQAVARLAHFLEFEVTVIDDRPAFTHAHLYPEGVRALCGDIPATVAGMPAGPDVYYVIVTRGHRHDGETLAACIRHPAAYIGMIGSKRKILLIRKQFLEQGVASEDELDRVFSPMGLDIGSVTVPEIATSICAELVAVRRRCISVGRHLAEALPK